MSGKHSFGGDMELPDTTPDLNSRLSMAERKGTTVAV